MAVVREGGTSGNFSGATTSPQSLSFTMSAGNCLVAMVSLALGTGSVSSMTWKPDSGDSGKDQAMTQLIHQDGTGDVEIWYLMNPTLTVTGSVVEHSLSTAMKRIMGIHALSGTRGPGTATGTSAGGTTISTAPTSEVGAIVFDVLYGQNSTTSYTADAGPPAQTERWDTNTTGGVNNLRGCGSQEDGAAGTVTMGWTAGASTNKTIAAVSFNPVASMIYRPRRQIIRL